MASSPASSLNADQKDRPVVTFMAVLLMGVALHLHVSTSFLAPAAHFLNVSIKQSTPPTILETRNDSSIHTRVGKNPSSVNARTVTGENVTDDGRRANNNIATGTVHTKSHVVLHNKNSNNTLFRMQRKQQHMDTIRKMSPVMCAGLPKTGTTSLHRYFSSWRKHGSHYRSSHTYTILPNGTKPRAGACMQENLRHGNKMLKSCGPFQVWTDSGYANSNGNCFYPLWHALDEFIEQYPYATIILNTRNATEWTSSIHKWAGGSLARRWNACRHTNPSLPRTLQPREWIRFYEKYHDRIRNACKTHASLKCIEFDISDANAGEIMEASFGIPASQWMDCNPQGMKCKQAS